jgi:uncharacterized protein (DUF2141 family)
MPFITRTILGFAIGLTALSGLSYPNTADTVFPVGGVITNYRIDRPIYIALYANEAELKAMKGKTSLRFKPGTFSADTLRYVFTNVKPGFYVVAAYQDIDMNKKLNMGFFGPTEPYSIYQHNYGMFGPAFKACKFLVDKPVTNADLQF